MTEQLVPPDFEVPTSFEGPGFRLEPLDAVHNLRDHEAWMSSIEHINSTAGFEARGWPRPMSLAENLSDLVGHAEEFLERSAFAFSVLDGDEVVGCLYLDPPDSGDHDVAIRSWVRESRAELDQIVWRSVSKWIAEVWPFTNPRYAARA